MKKCNRALKRSCRSDTKAEHHASHGPSCNLVGETYSPRRCQPRIEGDSSEILLVPLAHDDSPVFTCFSRDRTITDHHLVRDQGSEVQILSPRPFFSFRTMEDQITAFCKWVRDLLGP
jgi:hypothetical protein